MYKLKYAVQNYAWGKCGEESEVYKLLIANGATNVDNTLPYAELWLGTHLSGPSIIELNNKKLMDEIIDNHKMLGFSTLDKFGVNLPFLLKVLSVKTALSIQVHPNKKEAERLYRINPAVYKDDNHKPELAIALTKFEALVAFRSLEEITFFIKSIPQLKELVKHVENEYLDLIAGDKKSAALKVCYEALMKSSPSSVSKAVGSLVVDLQSGKSLEYLSEKHLHLADLFLSLNSQYPNDIGCFSLFLLNYVILEPGEAIFLSANLPHAYLSGNVIECMASSDNVIRAGLTPKPKDIVTLLSMLNYEPCPVSQLKFKPVRLPSVNSAIIRDLFAPPVEDFAVERINIGKVPGMTPLGDVYETASIILIVSGTGLIQIGHEAINNNQLPYARGNAFFVSAGVVMSIKTLESTVLFRAFANTAN